MISKTLACLSLAFLVLRPSAAVEINSLDGNWQFRTANETEWRTIKVPGSWESQFPDLRDYSGRTFYRTQFRVARDWTDKAIILKFGAVDWQATVRVNGKEVGSHEGGYTPFEFEIQDYVQTGLNQLEVEVLDVGPGRPVDGLSFDEIPHGKQSWYGTCSGIWQSVHLETRDLSYLQSIRVVPNIDAGNVTVKGKIRWPFSGGNLIITVSDGDGPTVVSAGSLKFGETDFERVIKIPKVHFWDPDNPHLYKAQVSIFREGKAVETQTVRFGMRKIEVKDNLVYLNNHPIFLCGALDQDFYPLTEYTPPSEAFLRDQFEKARHLGLNMLRCHIKMPDPRYLEAADKAGVLIWYEIPNVGVLNDKSKARMKAVLEGMIERDYNHPSLAIISIINEGWGINYADASQRAWVKEMYEFAKEHDPTRLIDDNSACGGNFHVKTDIEDFHAYFAIPDHYDGFASWIADFAKHPSWTFSPHGDADRRGWEPLILSEFGNWGLPKISLLDKCYSGEPWWFATGGGATNPKGAEQRFMEHGLDKVFRDYDDLAEVSQQQEWIALKYQIEEMRKHLSIIGYVITEFTDLNWESNGLLDMCRNPKVFHDRMHLVQAQDILIPDWKEVNYRSGDKLSMDVLVSHFSTLELSNCRLESEMEGIKGQITGVKAGDHTTTKAGTIELTIPPVESPKKVPLRMKLFSSDGKLVAENYQDINVFPVQSASGRKVAVHDPRSKLGDLDDRLRGLGYEVVSDLSGGGILISHTLDGDVTQALDEGATVILLATGAGSMNAMGPGALSVKRRDSSGWWGDWCSSIIWFKKQGPLANLPLGRNLDFEFHRMIPKSVIVGMDPQKDADDILSGIFVGWVQYPGVIMCQFRMGKGKVLATTLDIGSAGDDPAAMQLLHDMIEYAASPEFQPVREVDASAYTPPVWKFVGTAEYGAEEWKYVTKRPRLGWEGVYFDDSAWEVGRSGFGTAGTPNSIIGTTWDTSDIWLRQKSVVTDKVKRAVLRFYHDEDFEVYLNGKLILERKGFVTDYDSIPLDAEALSAFRKGENVLAVHCRQSVGGQFVDVGLWYDVE